MATNAVLRSPASTTAAAPTVAQLSTLTAGERALLSELRSINVSLSATNAPIKSQELYYLLLQFFGVIAATAFGVFSILAWTVANKSNAISTSALSVSLQSNQLALLAYCLSEENSSSQPEVAAVCAKVISSDLAYIGSIIGTAMPNVPTSVAITSSTTTSITTSKTTTRSTTSRRSTSSTTPTTYTTTTPSVLPPPPPPTTTTTTSAFVPPPPTTTPTTTPRTSLSSTRTTTSRPSTTSRSSTGTTTSRLSTTTASTLTTSAPPPVSTTSTASSAASPTTAPVTGNSSVGQHIDTATIIGTVLGAVFGAILLFSIMFLLARQTYREKMRRLNGVLAHEKESESI